jgi:hypothetical protein
MPEMPTVDKLDELTELAQRCLRLFVRWSRGPSADVMGASCDDLTGIPLPGLSANPLAVEPWWGDRPLRLWIARRLYDYSHLKGEKGPGVRPWVLEGRQLGRGPDNEPLVRCDRPVAWIAEQVISEAVRVVEEQNDSWGPLRRPANKTGRLAGPMTAQIAATPAIPGPAAENKDAERS